MGNLFKSYVNKYLLTEIYSRYNRGGFLIGDVVHLKADFNSDPKFKEVPEPVRNQFIELANVYKDCFLRVMEIRTHDALPNAPYRGDQPIDMIDVKFDIGGGVLYGGPFTLPTSIFEVDENMLNGMYPKVPEHFIQDMPDGKPV